VLICVPRQWEKRRQTISRPVQTRVNERIRIREVRLIDENGEQVGIIPTFDALQMARERGLDLVEVAPNAMPPVCRLMDYGKFRYEQSRKERESRRHQHTVELKEVRIRPKIDDHDLETKGRQAAKFLNAGDKVKLTVLFRGREMAHPDLGKALLDQLADQLRPHGTVEAAPRMEGRTMTMFMAPLKAKTSMADRERERERERDKEGTRGDERAGQAEEDQDENPQGGQEAVQDHRERQDHAHQGHEEPQPAQEGAAGEAPV
jgi:translation initiation factor IF-3